MRFEFRELPLVYVVVKIHVRWFIDQIIPWSSQGELFRQRADETFILVPETRVPSTIHLAVTEYTLIKVSPYLVLSADMIKQANEAELPSCPGVAIRNNVQAKQSS